MRFPLPRRYSYSYQMVKTITHASKAPPIIQARKGHTIYPSTRIPTPPLLLLLVTSPSTIRRSRARRGPSPPSRTRTRTYAPTATPVGTAGISIEGQFQLGRGMLGVIARGQRGADTRSIGGRRLAVVEVRVGVVVRVGELGVFFREFFQRFG
jgi:hypothetical protein